VKNSKIKNKKPNQDCGGKGDWGYSFENYFEKSQRGNLTNK
jgi:hypothetical protein